MTSATGTPFKRFQSAAIPRGKQSAEFSPSFSGQLDLQFPDPDGASQAF
jgi:hypothetical protein